MVVFISRTIIEKTSLTLMRDLAEASINGHPHNSAKPCPKIQNKKQNKIRKLLEAYNR